MQLQEFLIKAKINTYASGAREKTLKDGSKELWFEEGDWRYRDRYFGFNSFIGEEIIWRNDEAVWGMNYCGRIISNNANSKDIFNFLQKAMKLIKIDRPFRGPEKFHDGDWGYRDESVGNVEDFSGIERIYFKEEKVFELKYCGGKINL